MNPVLDVALDIAVILFLLATTALIGLMIVHGWRGPQ